jgi:hypothetical protein
MKTLLLAVGVVLVCTAQPTDAGQDCGGITHSANCGHMHAGGKIGSCHGGEGIIKCDDQEQNACEGLEAVEAEAGWWEKCVGDPTYKLTEGDVTIDCFSAHNNCFGTSTPCWRNVVCTWSESKEKCIVVSGSGGPWNNKDKLSTARCE